MGYERYSRGNDQGREYGPARDYSYSSARDYAAADLDDDDFSRARSRYRDDDGDREQGRYGRQYQGRQTGYGQDRGGDRVQERPYRGSYASDGRPFAQPDRDSRHDRDRDRERGRSQGRPAGRAEGYDYDDRGFFDRAGDEVRSWFGDEDAERRRELDQRNDERRAREEDRQYHSWRTERVAEFDRDYDEYRRENATKFGNEFGTWRTERQGQRDLLRKVDEHMEVLGSDGEHVGTVDKVRGDRIVLTKNDADAGGHHHSIPSRWIDSVDDKVKIRKTAAEAQREWRDEERNRAGNGDRAFFGGEQRRGSEADRPGGGTDLNRSFSGTY